MNKFDRAHIRDYIDRAKWHIKINDGAYIVAVIFIIGILVGVTVS